MPLRSSSEMRKKSIGVCARAVSLISGRGGRVKGLRDQCSEASGVEDDEVNTPTKSAISSVVVSGARIFVVHIHLPRPGVGGNRRGCRNSKDHEFAGLTDWQFDTVGSITYECGCETFYFFLEAFVFSYGVNGDFGFEFTWGIVRGEAWVEEG